MLEWTANSRSDSGPWDQAGVGHVGFFRELSLSRLWHSFCRMDAEFLTPTVPDLMEKTDLVKWVPGESFDCDHEELCKRGRRLGILCGVCPCGCSILFGPMLAGVSEAILSARLIC